MAQPPVVCQHTRRVLNVERAEADRGDEVRQRLAELLLPLQELLSRPSRRLVCGCSSRRRRLLALLALLWRRRGRIAVVILVLLLLGVAQLALSVSWCI